MAGEIQPTTATTEPDAARRASAPVSYAGLDDAAVVDDAKLSPDAFVALYVRHVRSVFAFCYWKLEDGYVVEDLTSQTFLPALRALPRYQERGTPFKSWLFRIAANLITDRHRAQRSEQPREAPPPGYDAGVAFEPADPKSEAAITAWEQAEDFSGMIADLTPEQLAVVRLRFAEGLPMADIAIQVGRTEGAVKMLLMRALQNLRRRLDQEAAHAG